LFLSFLHLLTCIYIVSLTSSLLLCPYTHFQVNLFHPFILWFCWRETIGDNKKDIAFLLLWDKDSYI
jgi:hypothetical protein